MAAALKEWLFFSCPTDRSNSHKHFLQAVPSLFVLLYLAGFASFAVPGPFFKIEEAPGGGGGGRVGRANEW